MGSKGNKSDQLLSFDPISDPCAGGLICTLLDNVTADKRMYSATVDFYELSRTACSNLKIRCAQRARQHRRIL
jgi:hypothetical protein